VNYREESKRDWRRSDGCTPDIDQLKFGALQRIADATEAMAKNHVSLMAERDRFERWYNDERKRRERLERRVNALRGVITKMKKARHP